VIPKVANWKRDAVADLKDQIDAGGVFAVIDIHGVPADSMLGMRAELYGKMAVSVAKKQLMRLAWRESGRDPEDLEKLFEGATQPALVQTDALTSFELFRELKKTEAGRAAKPGDVAPCDIIVEKQDTGMAPGPIVGELNTVDIPAKIMGGSVHIQKTVTVLKEGEVFTDDLGLLLSKLDINPIITGLRLCGTLEDGVIFAPETLDIDIEAFEQQVIGTIAGAHNLACNIRWFTTQTTPVLLGKASSEALAVAMEAGITNSKTLPFIIAKAVASAMGVAGQLDSEALDDELREQLGAAAAVAATTPDAEDTNAAPAEDAEEDEEDEDAGFDGLGDLFG
jgi:large subunit ribosomal protein L10